MQQQSTTQTIPPTIADELDRLDVIAGKVGLISRESALSLLRGLDDAYRQIREISTGTASRRIAEAQFQTIVSKLEKEASQFLKDLGGGEALQQARETVRPPEEHTWWHLDKLVANRRRSLLKRALIITLSVAAFLAIFIFVYNQFFAPDPEFVAVYGHEQTARDKLLAQDLDAALSEVEQGLAINPQEPSLLLMKGVILEAQGNDTEAQQTLRQARQVLNNDPLYYVSLGETYTLMNDAEKALANAEQALAIDPQLGQAHLLIGAIYEAQGDKPRAMEAYNQAYEAANARGELQLAALARTRIAFMMQGGAGALDPLFTPTAEAGE